MPAMKSASLTSASPCPSSPRTTSLSPGLMSNRSRLVDPQPYVLVFHDTSFHTIHTMCERLCRHELAYHQLNLTVLGKSYCEWFPLHMIEVLGSKHMADIRPYGVARHPKYSATLLPFLTPPRAVSHSAIIEARPTGLAADHVMAKETQPIRDFPDTMAYPEGHHAGHQAQRGHHGHGFTVRESACRLFGQVTGRKRKTPYFLARLSFLVFRLAPKQKQVDDLSHLPAISWWTLQDLNL